MLADKSSEKNIAEIQQPFISALADELPKFVVAWSFLAYAIRTFQAPPTPMAQTDYSRIKAAVSKKDGRDYSDSLDMEVRIIYSVLNLFTHCLLCLSLQFKKPASCNLH